MTKIKLILIVLTFLLSPLIQAQDFTQTIRGRVTDRDSRQSLPGVTVVIPNSEPLRGATTDMDGRFRIENVPVGRVGLRFSFIGYQPQELNNLELTTGKELILNIELVESVSRLDEVVITANQDEVRNEMATVSARSFSIEESQRFAGARNDVSRMAGNFAGVNTANDAVNDIVVRGNSPLGVLWRLDDIDIFNPNHFGAAGATGGPVSMLNNNVLSDSDFLTAAFPAMYGNALSSVFDLRMRAGNNERHEFLGQIGFNGFELGAEGPLNREKGSSYIANYRYSVLSFMNAIGFNPGTGTGVPNYQDLSFKLNFPQSKLGAISVFGLAGNNSIDFVNSETPVDELPEDFYSDGDQDVYNANHMGVVGVSQVLSWSARTYSKLVLSAQTAKNATNVDSLTVDARQPRPYYRMSNQQNRLSGHFFVNHKKDAANVFRVGIMADVNQVSMSDSIYLASLDGYRSLTDEDGQATLLRGYAQWKHSFSDDLVLNAGLYSQYFALNGSISAEPRLGIEWRFRPRQRLTAGYGLHSQTPPFPVFFRETAINGRAVQTNHDLGFQRSNHMVLGYGYHFENGLRFKAEAYYQYIDQVPVELRPSAYSLLNAGSFGMEIRDSLFNGGTGRNYGIDFSLEKTMRRGNYFIINASLYDSKYKGSDGVLRNTAFNGHYLFNAVGGKEWILSGEDAKNRKALNVDLKVTFAGGLRYTLIDQEASTQAQNTVLDRSNPFSEQFDPYFRSDVRIGYKVFYKKFTQEWALDVQNVSNTQNPLAISYDWRSGEQRVINQLGIFPLVQYRITF